jgi:hypothetical protein
VKQRMGDKKRKEVEEIIGRPVRTLLHRGGRNPRYYDVFFGEPDDTEGDVGFFFPAYRETIGGKVVEHEWRLEMEDVKWTDPRRKKELSDTPQP